MFRRTLPLTVWESGALTFSSSVSNRVHAQAVSIIPTAFWRAVWEISLETSPPPFPPSGIQSVILPIALSRRNNHWASVCFTFTVEPATALTNRVCWIIKEMDATSENSCGMCQMSMSWLYSIIQIDQYNKNTAFIKQRLKKIILQKHLVRKTVKYTWQPKYNS